MERLQKQATYLVRSWKRYCARHMGADRVIGD
jgi:hypothetical protein